MQDWNGPALFTACIVSAGSAVYLLLAHRIYVMERFRRGIVSAFMLAMLLFLLSEVAHASTILWLLQEDKLGRMQSLLCLIAALGTTLGLGILSYLTYTRKYDLWIRFKRISRKEKEVL
ncbi:hypothetical protein [Cohnella hashimotonis]|uniref:Uncharacterized protein n=1 Tax=Cohnella hashimotonis TaxID=2826895 RepID=A0ABT6TLF1_9BACL|nr:hypothetical protein [Cohnella hashimotonis]MDI4647401.1 hypothetical protein [Cohnella hashimotonis]